LPKTKCVLHVRNNHAMIQSSGNVSDSCKSRSSSTGGRQQHPPNPLAVFEGPLRGAGGWTERKTEGRKGTETVGEKHPENKFLVSALLIGYVLSENVTGGGTWTTLMKSTSTEERSGRR